MAAAASDKARYFMEQSVPELQELSRKGIFTKAEITSIAQKRSEFEHLINMAGAAKPADYARYATYEMNLDSLRKKRSKRLGVKTTTYTGQRKVFFVLERGVRRFQGDMGLWMQYLEFCKQEVANKKLSKALTQCLRLHPLKWELWVWAARHYVETQADMTSGRSFMQRGLRFCQNERNMWLQYAKLEMLYVAKIAARRKILGLDEQRSEKQIDSNNDPNADMITLPQVTAEDLNPEVKKDTAIVDEKTLQKLASTPAMSGAIPIAIMDSAMSHFKQDPYLAEQFFDLFAEFPDTPCTIKLLQHAIGFLELNAEKKGAGALLAVCNAKTSLLGVSATSPEFPLALGKALQQLKTTSSSDQDFETLLASRAVAFMLPYLEQQDELDEGIKQVLDASIKRYTRVLRSCKPSTRGRNHLSELTKNIQKDKRVSSELLLEYGLSVPDEG